MKTKRCLVLEDVKKIASGCEAEALRENWAVSIAIVDDGGHALWLQRLDGATLTSPLFAAGKARTAAMGRKPSKVYEDMVNNGRIAALSMPGELTLMEGGEPIVVDNEVVGAVGVSGVKPAQDVQIARAGIELFLAELGD
jgi:glc operon protein GlcG